MNFRGGRTLSPVDVAVNQMLDMKRYGKFANLIISLFIRLYFHLFIRSLMSSVGWSLTNLINVLLFCLFGILLSYPLCNLLLFNLFDH